MNSYLIQSVLHVKRNGNIALNYSCKYWPFFVFWYRNLKWALFGYYYPRNFDSAFTYITVESFFFLCKNVKGGYYSRALGYGKANILETTRYHPVNVSIMFSSQLPYWNTVYWIWKHMENSNENETMFINKTFHAVRSIRILFVSECGKHEWARTTMTQCKINMYEH